jgi:hypothetical protein
LSGGRAPPEPNDTIRFAYRENESVESTAIRFAPIFITSFSTAFCPLQSAQESNSENQSSTVARRS